MRRSLRRSFFRPEPVNFPVNRHCFIFLFVLFKNIGERRERSRTSAEREKETFFYHPRSTDFEEKIEGRARRTSGKAREDEWQSPRPPLLFNAPNQNRHATQDRKKWFPLTRRCKIASFTLITQCFYASVNSSCAQPPPSPG